MAEMLGLRSRQCGKALILVTAFVVIALSACATMCREGRHEVITVDALQRKMQDSDSFVVLLELESCSACKKLRETCRASNSWKASDVIIVNVEEPEKETLRVRLQTLFPDFQFYPSLYRIERGAVESEFDLSTLEGFEERFEDWVG